MTLASAWAGGYSGANLTNPTYLQGEDDSLFATWVNAARNATAVWYATTFDLSGVPSGSTINSVTVRIKGYVSHAGTPIDYLHAQLYAGSTGKGSTYENLALSTTSTNVWATFQYADVVYDDLASLQVWFEGDRANSTVQSTMYIDSVQLTVDYTAGGGDQNLSDSDSSGTTAEAATLEALVPGADSGSGTEAVATLEALVSGADSATGSESAQLTAGNDLAESDGAGPASEATTLEALLVGTDAGTASDSHSLDVGAPPPKPGELWIRRRKN